MTSRSKLKRKVVIKMTQAQAKKEARKLFGKNGTASIGWEYNKDKTAPKVKEYRIGQIIDLGIMAANMIKGYGPSWEVALEEAKKVNPTIGI